MYCSTNCRPRAADNVKTAAVARRGARHPAGSQQQCDALYELKRHAAGRTTNPPQPNGEEGCVLPVPTVGTAPTCIKPRHVAPSCPERGFDLPTRDERAEYTSAHALGQPAWPRSRHDRAQQATMASARARQRKRRARPRARTPCAQHKLRASELQRPCASTVSRAPEVHGSNAPQFGQRSAAT